MGRGDGVKGGRKTGERKGGGAKGAEDLLRGAGYSLTGPLWSRTDDQLH